MKKLILIFATCLALSAVDLTFTWSLPPGTTTDLSTNGETVVYPDITGYSLYHSNTSSNFVVIARFPVGDTNAVVTNLVPGNHFFLIRSTNMWGESSNSNVIATPPAVAPKVNELRLKLLTGAPLP